jgi:hypothetical protein
MGSRLAIGIIEKLVLKQRIQRKESQIKMGN